MTESAAPGTVTHVPRILAHLRHTPSRDAMLSAVAFNRLRRQSLAAEVGRRRSMSVPIL